MMLTETIQPTSAQDYDLLNSSIKDTFAAIDGLELQAIEQIRVMRDQQLYRIPGYKNFERYCQGELHIYGGYRRINQLLGASIVIRAAGELGSHIKNERQARPLLRLAKEPEKLIKAITLALSSNPDPSESDFARAASQVSPKLRRKNQSTFSPMVPNFQEPMVPENRQVTVSSPEHPLYGQSGVILADPPNRSQQIVTFNESERILVNNDDLDGLIPAIADKSIERKYPPEYTEAIASLKQQHLIELERLEKDLRIGLLIEARTLAQEQVLEELSTLEKLKNQYKEETIKLRQELDKMQVLRQFEVENQLLKQRNLELERALEERQGQQWPKTMTKEATKADKQVEHPLKALEPEKENGEKFKSKENTLTPDPKPKKEDFIDLRSLAIEPPKENGEECLLLMAMALKNLGSAMNNTQALEAAAIILGSQPTQAALTHRVEQLELLPLAVNDIRAVLTKPGCTWQEYCTVALEYEVIKLDYWTQLTLDETDLIVELERIFTERDQMIPGSIIKHTDPYCPFNLMSGKVVEDYGDEVLVAWDYLRPQPEDLYRYFKSELCLYKGRT